MSPLSDTQVTLWGNSVQLEMVSELQNVPCLYFSTHVTARAAWRGVLGGTDGPEGKLEDAAVIVAL